MLGLILLAFILLGIAALPVAAIVLIIKRTNYKPEAVSFGKCAVGTDKEKVFDEKKEFAIAVDDEQLTFTNGTTKIDIPMSKLKQISIAHRKCAKYHQLNTLELFGDSPLVGESKIVYVQFSTAYELHYWKKTIKQHITGVRRQYIVKGENGKALFDSFNKLLHEQVQQTITSVTFKQMISDEIRLMPNLPGVKLAKVKKIEFRTEAASVEGELVQATMDDVLKAEYHVSLSKPITVQLELSFAALPLRGLVDIKVEKFDGVFTVNCLPENNFWISLDKMGILDLSSSLVVGPIHLPGFASKNFGEALFREILSRMIGAPRAVLVSKRTDAEICTAETGADKHHEENFGADEETAKSNVSAICSSEAHDPEENAIVSQSEEPDNEQEITKEKQEVKKEEMTVEQEGGKIEKEEEIENKVQENVQVGEEEKEEAKKEKEEKEKQVENQEAQNKNQEQSDENIEESKETEEEAQPIQEVNKVSDHNGADNQKGDADESNAQNHEQNVDEEYDEEDQNQSAEDEIIEETQEQNIEETTNEKQEQEQEQEQNVDEEINEEGQEQDTNESTNEQEQKQSTDEEINKEDQGQSADSKDINEEEQELKVEEETEIKKQQSEEPSEEDTEDQDVNRQNETDETKVDEEEQEKEKEDDEIQEDTEATEEEVHKSPESAEGKNKSAEEQAKNDTAELLGTSQGLNLNISLPDSKKSKRTKSFKNFFGLIKKSSKKEKEGRQTTEEQETTEPRPSVSPQAASPEDSAKEEVSHSESRHHHHHHHRHSTAEGDEHSETKDKNSKPENKADEHEKSEKSETKRHHRSKSSKKLSEKEKGEQRSEKSETKHKRKPSKKADASETVNNESQE